MKKDLRDLFCNKKNVIKEIQVMIFCFCEVQMYFLVLFNSSELKGNPLWSIILLSAAEATGAFISPFVIQALSLKSSVVVSSLLLCVASHTAKFSSPSDKTLMVCIMVFSIMIGMITNFYVLVNTQLIEPRFRFLTLEINFSIG